MEWFKKSLKASQDKSLHCRDKSTSLCSWWRENSCGHRDEGQELAVGCPQKPQQGQEPPQCHPHSVCSHQEPFPALSMLADFGFLGCSELPGLLLTTVCTFLAKLLSSQRKLNTRWHSSSSQPAVRIWRGGEMGWKWGDWAEILFTMPVLTVDKHNLSCRFSGEGGKGRTWARCLRRAGKSLPASGGA